MPINITFGGATITRPGAYSVVDTEGMMVIASGGFKILTVIGIPNATNTLTLTKVSYFNDPITAKAAIGVCESLDLMQKMWVHGADLIGFSPVAQTGLDDDWQAAIDRLTTESIDGLMVASNEAAINAKLSAHCILMSSVLNRKERRAFYGHASGLAVSAITALQAALAGELGTMATPGEYYGGVLKGSEYLAASYAGIWASQPSQEPITYKYVTTEGLEKVYTGTEITTLLAACIAPTEYVRNRGYRIVQGVTLYSAEDDLSMQELSVSSSKIDMNQRLRDYFEARYIGKAGVAGIEITMFTDLISQLDSFKIEGLITDYVKESVAVIKNGTAYTLQWEGKPTLPINNFLITTHLNI